MGRFIVRRSLSAIALLLATSFLVFSFFELIPNYNPARAIAGRNANQTTVNQVAKKFDLDKPFYVQYANTMKLIFTGQVIDYQNDLNVVDQFKSRFPVTLSLVIPGGDHLAGRVDPARLDQRAEGGPVDRPGGDGGRDRRRLGPDLPVSRAAAVPVRLQVAVFPNTGYTHFGDSPTQWAYHLILPWISIAVLIIGFYSRVLRSNLLDMVNQDYVRTARAKGLSQRRVFTRHVLRNSLMPIMTLFGLDFALLLGGAALVTETVFNLPGIGQFEAQRDRQPRRSPDPRRRDLHRVLRRPVRRHRRRALRRARPADPAHRMTVTTRGEDS